MNVTWMTAATTGCRCAVLWLALVVAPNHSALLADQLQPAPEGTFSIVVIPDTQHYYGRGTKREPESEDPLTNPTFDAWTDWIVANLDRQRVVFVSHVGDIVDRNNRGEWAVARRCMDKLRGKVPYGISVGNHDMECATGDSSLFQEVFPESRFDEFEWYAGSFENSSGNPAISGNNANSVQLFEAGGMKFVILHLECGSPDNVLEWANTQLQRYAGRRAMITTHMGLGPLERPQTKDDYFDAPKGRMKWSKCHNNVANSAQAMWEKCFRKHENLFMVCCGDQSRTQAMRLSSNGDHGNTIHELLSDYGVKGLRIMRFVPEKDLIEVRTWDPIHGRLCEATAYIQDRNQHQFTLTYQMSSALTPASEKPQEAR